MSRASAHLRIGTRVVIDGEIFEITELLQRTTGVEVVVTGSTSPHRLTLAALLTSDRAKLLADKTSPTNPTYGDSK